VPPSGGPLGGAGGGVGAAAPAVGNPGGAAAAPVAKRQKIGDEDLFFGNKGEHMDVLQGLVSDKDMSAGRELQTVAGTARVSALGSSVRARVRV